MAATFQNGTKDFNLLFLIGVMRSGTTYFRNILSLNQNIFGFPGELNAFWSKKVKAPCGITNICPPMTMHDITDDIVNIVHRYFYSRYRSRNCFYEIIYRSYRKLRYKNESIIKKGIPFYLLNKSTHLMNKISFVNAIFPHSKFIFILRDIYSHANSLKNHLYKIKKQGYWSIEYPPTTGECWRFHHLKKQNQMMPRNSDYIFEDIPTYWIEINSFALDALDRIEEGRILYVNFDTLFYRPKRILMEIEGFLGIAHLDYSFSKKLINQSTNDPANQWKKDLTKTEILTIDRVIKNHQSEYDSIINHVSSRLT